MRTGFPAARSHTPTPRPYSTEHVKIDTNSPKTVEAGPAEAPADEPDLDSLFKFGENLAGINYHNKTIKTAVGSLPISPLLDPTWRKARKPHKKKKPPPVDRMPRFQRNMKRNPYAQLLAEPVRQCHVTRARLPKPFLQGFGLVTHPKTQELWWMPAGFEEPSKEPGAEAHLASEDGTVSSSDLVSAEPDSTNKASLSTATGHESKAAEVQGKPPTKQNRAFWAPAHVLARQDLLMEFLDKKSKHSGGQFRFAIVQSVGKLVGKATWRKDMHEVLRERMRRGIVDELIDVSQTCENGERNYLIKIGTPEDSLRYQNNHCFLCFTGKHKPFNYLEVLSVPGSARPVYCLPELLGSEQMQRLKSSTRFFADESLSQEGSLVLLKGKGNVDLTKRLWRLQGFLANYMELN